MFQKLIIFSLATETTIGLYIKTWKFDLLGVNIDIMLDWRVHASTISSYSYALCIISELGSIDAALAAYYTFVQSRLRFGVLHKRCIPLYIPSELPREL